MYRMLAKAIKWAREMDGERKEEGDDGGKKKTKLGPKMFKPLIGPLQLLLVIYLL